MAAPSSYGRCQTDVKELPAKPNGVSPVTMGTCPVRSRISLAFILQEFLADVSFSEAIVNITIQELASISPHF